MSDGAALNPRDMDPRELLRGLMRGDPATFKAGYSAPNAIAAVAELKPGLAAGEYAVLFAYAEGFEAGLDEGRGFRDPDRRRG